MPDLRFLGVVWKFFRWQWVIVYIHLSVIFFKLYLWDPKLSQVWQIRPTLLRKLSDNLGNTQTDRYLLKNPFLEQDYSFTLVMKAKELYSFLKRLFYWRWSGYMFNFNWKIQVFRFKKLKYMIALFWKKSFSKSRENFQQNS